MPSDPEYLLEEHVGFVLRQVSQRHLSIFSALMPDGLTPTQFSALQRLRAGGPCSQNRLGRLIAVDAATIKGVVERLAGRGLVGTAPDAADARRLTVSLTEAGAAVAAATTAVAWRITEATLAPLDAAERATLLALLNRLR